MGSEKTEKGGRLGPLRPTLAERPPTPPYDPLHGFSEGETVFFDCYMKTLDAAGSYDVWARAMGRPIGKQRHTNAFKMLHKPRMQSAIIEAQKRIMENSTITAIKVLNDLEEERKGAIDAQQFAAAIKASELQGKHIGMFNEGYADREKGPMIFIVTGTGRDEGKTVTIEYPGNQALITHKDSSDGQESQL